MKKKKRNPLKVVDWCLWLSGAVQIRQMRTIHPERTHPWYVCVRVLFVDAKASRGAAAV